MTGMTEADYDALSQKQLASLKRDTRISLEDAAVRATHKVMAELGEEHMETDMIPPHPPNWAYFYEGYPKLYHDNAGNYMIGLGNLFGAHLCIGKPNEIVDHEFVDNKCIACGIQRKPREHICDIGCNCGKIVKEKNNG